MATTSERLLEGRRAPAFRGSVAKVVRLARAYPLGAIGAVFVCALIAMSIAPWVFTPLDSQDPLQQRLIRRLEGPSLQHWFGLDELGRDLYARVVYGARTATVIGVFVVIISQSLAIVIGVFSGYHGGWRDSVGQRLVDIGMSLPWLVTIILVVQTLINHVDDVIALILAVGLLLSMNASRTVRGVAISIRTEQYVDAAKALGASDLRIMLRHIVPNVFPYVIVSASILVGSAVLIESSLSFLGYGVQPPTPSWGRMLSDARENLVHAPHIAFFPGAMIFATVFSLNMLGDALRDRLDPRLRGGRADS